MILYDDPAAAALQDAAEHAQRPGSVGYGTEHVLLGLLRTGDPVTQRVIGTRPQVTVDAVRDRLPAPDHAASRMPDAPRRIRPVPAPEFTQAMSRFTAKWRPLVTSGRLRASRKLGVGELWLAVLEPGTESAGLLRSLGADPDDLRAVVLDAMSPENQPPPVWPAEVPVGPVRRVLERLLGRGEHP